MSIDVLKVEITPPHRVKVLTTFRDAENAAAFINIAVMRQGVETHFFTTKPTGAFKDGDCLPQKTDEALTPGA